MSSPPTIAPIVEGKGEVDAMGPLIRRIAREFFDVFVQVAQPHRLDAGKMRKSTELERAVLLQARYVRGGGGILIVRDGDDDDVRCAHDLVPELTPSPGLVAVPVQVVIAFREFEAWFLAAAESLRGHSAVRDDAVSDPDPEGHRGAKERLRQRMLVKYSPTVHQPAFCSILDLAAAHDKSRSFRRLVHAVELLIGRDT